MNEKESTPESGMNYFERTIEVKSEEIIHILVDGIIVGTISAIRQDGIKD